MHISSIPINDFAIANEDGLVERDMELFYPCCGKSIIVAGVSIPSVSPETISVHFAMPTMLTKQTGS
jgi:hypothetical protein